MYLMIGSGKRRAIFIGVIDALIVIFSALLALALRFNFAVGIPARVIKQYNPETGLWKCIKPSTEDYYEISN